MNTTEFQKTITKAIVEYRQILRKQLPQIERIEKLKKLNLKNSIAYKNNVALYHIAKAIIEDIENNLYFTNKNYYTYSGIKHFCKYLKNFLNEYELKFNGKKQAIIHKKQEASNALLKAVQLLGTSSNETPKKLEHYTHIIAKYGEKEQIHLYQKSLKKAHDQTKEPFYLFLLNQFNILIKENN